MGGRAEISRESYEIAALPFFLESFQKFRQLARVTARISGMAPEKKAGSAPHDFCQGIHDLAGRAWIS